MPNEVKSHGTNPSAFKIAVWDRISEAFINIMQITRPDMSKITKQQLQSPQIHHRNY